MNKRSFLSMLILFFLIGAFNASAQIEKIIKMDVVDGSVPLSTYIGLDRKINNKVRLVALGDLQPIHQESVRLNLMLSTYLIQHRAFNTVIISLPDWKTRTFNQYLKNTEQDFLQTEFDQLFQKTFQGSRYYNNDFKNFFIWLKKYNLTERKIRAGIRGIGFVAKEPSGFADMNQYFIDTYIRPYNHSIADSVQLKWAATGNINSIVSDSVVLRWMRAWAGAAADKNLFPKDLQYQMKTDIITRESAHSIIANSRLTASEKYTQIIWNSATLEFGLISDMMKLPSSKIIFLSSNALVANAELHLYDSKEPKPISSYPVNGASYKKKYKDAYFNTATTFADSASVIGFKNSKPLQTILIYGDNKAKELLKTKKDFLFMPDNSYLIKSLNIPVINSGKIFNEESYLKMQYFKDSAPFDMVFIFPSLTPIHFLK